MAKQLSRKLQQVYKDMDKLIERDLPRIVKREGLQFISDNFEKEGFQTSQGAVDKWKRRQPPKSRKARRRAGRNILVDRGHLRRSWEQDSQQKPGKVIFASDLPYAEPHNEGTEDLPERKMIGESQELNRRVEKKIDEIMEKILTK